jgi:hypothetical protein
MTLCQFIKAIDDFNGKFGLKTVTLIRHFRPVKKRAKAKKALTRLRTIANKLIRELQRKLPQYLLFEKPL